MTFQTAAKLTFFNTGCAPAMAACMWCEDIFLRFDRGYTLSLPSGPGRRTPAHYHEACLYALAYGDSHDRQSLWLGYFPDEFDVADDCLQAWQSGGRAVIPKDLWLRYQERTARKPSRAARPRPCKADSPTSA